jgi:hypothetical protein
MCQIAGAERLVDLDGTGDMHTPGNQFSPFYGFTYEQLEELVATGAHFKIPTFADKSPFPEQVPIHGWENCHICAYQNPDNRHDDPAFHEQGLHEDIFKLYRKMGMLTSTRAPTISRRRICRRSGSTARGLRARSCRTVTPRSARARISTVRLPPAF